MYKHTTNFCPFERQEFRIKFKFNGLALIFSTGILIFKTLSLLSAPPQIKSAQEITHISRKGRIHPLLPICFIDKALICEEKEVSDRHMQILIMVEDWQGTQNTNCI